MRFGIVALLVVGCSDEESLTAQEEEVCFNRRDGVPVCIETYEAARQDAAENAEGVASGPPRSIANVRPWTGITWEAALEACRAKGSRLCDRDEWIDACDGGIGEAEGSLYPYGETRDPSLCNVQGGGPVAGGRFTMCLSGLGTQDQAGNVWEWTGNAPSSAAARGGSFRSSQTHACLSGDRMQRFDPLQPNEEVGFRCCRTR